MIAVVILDSLAFIKWWKKIDSQLRGEKHEETVIIYLLSSRSDIL